MWISSPPRSAGEGGFSFIEVLVALGIFLVVSVGVLSVLGATTAGGLQDAAPTALAAGRRAKDLTVAAVYVQALHDYLASQEEAVWNAVFDSWPSGAVEQTYCIRSDGAPCGGGEPVPPAFLGGYPRPETEPYQFTWTILRIAVQRWFWDCAAKRYTFAPPSPTRDLLVRIHTTLFWRLRGELRTLTPGSGGVDRFLPYGSSVPAPSAEACS